MLTAELIVAVISAIIAFAGFISAWHARAKANHAQELQKIKEEATTQTSQKLDDLKETMRELKDEDIHELKIDMKAVRHDITTLQVTTGVHDAMMTRDRANLRAVND